ncbi:response regulator [Cellulosilyticum lentocellum]|uniref:Stage 0 sporulation protein A homolog n=1 Tax=Cellulosilyticum lentocellum (strain ATCC 49066 / DSM 5427 / NCIMB 11756 / RHM5) TaxID=642492 RepID=F2JLF5_CELLD|nr:response regulator [Cellulosilyticum lentocellum]ADZ82243.1 two component transcriptional regulator, AraC family [Cellulosilyticum lentocellum DSM 5427]
MIKVFLVEDEFAVRERMKKNIDWEDHGFLLVGEAGDGEMAYPMIQETQPDIIITDIKMPFMDGLELSKLIIETMPQVKIIILSGYDEFEYAKEAISIGVIDYLLKPISGKKLLESLKHVATIIDKQREQQKFYDKYKLDTYENEKQQKKLFLNDLINLKLPVSELIKKGKEFSIELNAPQYNILLIKTFIKDKALNNYWESNLDISRTLENKLQGLQEYILFDREEEGWVILIKGGSSGLKLLEKKCITILEGILSKEKSLSYCIGIGEEVNRLSELTRSFETASKAVACSYIMPNKKVIYYGDLDLYGAMREDETISIKNIDITKFDKKPIESFLRNGLRSEVSYFSENYLKDMGLGTDSFMFRQYIMMSIYFSVITFIKQLGYSEEYIVEVCGDFKEITMAIQTKEGTRKTLENILNQSLQFRDRVSTKKYNLLLDEAKEYIRENYNRETISLNSVAEYVNVSPSHFSTIFSQETGQTFISYLTEIRMEKAKELLRCSNMRTLEIGYAIGYKDPHYFSYLFKKTQQCTPKEYRKANKKS